MADELYTALEKVKESTKSASNKMEEAEALAETKGSILSRDEQSKLKGVFTLALDELFQPRGPQDPTDGDIVAVAFRKAFAILKNPELEPSKPGGTRAYRKKFDRCVKTVRKSVKPRRGSTKESAAIAICTKSVLQTRGRTMKRYKKGKLVTQKK
jgi:hypothetical protein